MPCCTRSPGCPARWSTPIPGSTAVTRTRSWPAIEPPLHRARPDLAGSGRGGPRGPGEAAHIGDLLGDLEGDLLAKGVSAADRNGPVRLPALLHVVPPGRQRERLRWITQSCCL